MYNTKIATEEEILETLTQIMRSGIDDGVKISDKLSAMDKLHKYLTENKESNKTEYGIVILPQVNEETEDL